MSCPARATVCSRGGARLSAQPPQRKRAKMIGDGLGGGCLSWMGWTQQIRLTGSDGSRIAVWSGSSYLP